MRVLLLTPQNGSGFPFGSPLKSKTTPKKLSPKRTSHNYATCPDPSLRTGPFSSASASVEPDTETRHGVALAGARLPIGEQAAVVAL